MSTLQVRCLSRRSIQDSRCQLGESDIEPLSSARVPVSIQPKLMRNFVHRSYTGTARHADSNVRITMHKGTLVSRRDDECQTGRYVPQAGDTPTTITQGTPLKVSKPRDFLRTNHLLKIKLTSPTNLMKCYPDSEMMPGNSSIPIELSQFCIFSPSRRHIRSRQSSSSLSKKSASRLSLLKLKLHRVPRGRTETHVSKQSDTVNFFDFNFDESRRWSPAKTLPLEAGDIDHDRGSRFQIDTIIDQEEFLDNLPEDFHRYLEEKKTLNELKTLSKTVSRKPSFAQPCAFKFEGDFRF